MLKSIATFIVIILTVTLSACVSPTGGLNPYVDGADGYKFLYPNGWMAVDVKDASEGVDVVFRDFIERSENLSVIISDVNKDMDLSDLGSPTDVGYRFMQIVNQDTNNQREAELISAEKREQNLEDYYLLEYKVKLGDNQYRHNLASVVTKNGKLYTFNISTTESRWENVENRFKTIVKSFTVT
ncbi:photosystem II reaction center PsbP [Cyanobacterium aponinum UTEX 3222]|uniref:Photosystem II oxygen evolving complex protein PsbP n=2 Tax=Cyanobacterium aponinum TaxID=379064 RepID=A0A844GQH5_9CHRO|nr:photosystem II reaction center PsbP [Cyanobacterium aponinum]WRL42371.1 photosystem II reaction center PsbP [Cyanobacterium aponinum UTEX 3222]MBD2392855.1 photosystem II reaction center PsbP family protein [Cyanobacterium aponinum FACHB-4101]MTF38160.1 photosystem II oxygen evolving complex protein PsbP [Cyanobacterium aponinum 0216]PHV63942.1 photosystem II oxygen evolving complex protein PsbP [Cyanobacterium aponinum IPPAS B-1201]WPF88727.1 photosystem II reaction center PsbP [Cyanobacte